MLVSTAQRRAIPQRHTSVSRGVSTQTADAAQEDSEAVRAIAFLRQIRCHASSAFNLLKSWRQLFNVFGRLAADIWIAITRSVTDSAQVIIAKGIGHCIWFAEIPRLKFSANNAYQCVIPSAFITNLAYPLFQDMAIRAVRPSPLKLPQPPSACEPTVLTPSIGVLRWIGV